MEIIYNLVKRHLVRVEDLYVDDKFVYNNDLFRINKINSESSRVKVQELKKDWSVIKELEIKKEIFIIPITGNHVERNRAIFLKDAPDNTMVILPNNQFTIRFKKSNGRGIQLISYNHLSDEPTFTVNPYQIVLPIESIDISITNIKRKPNRGRLNYLKKIKNT